VTVREGSGDRSASEIPAASPTLLVQGDPEREEEAEPAEQCEPLVHGTHAVGKPGEAWQRLPPVVIAHPLPCLWRWQPERAGPFEEQAGTMHDVDPGGDDRLLPAGEWDQWPVGPA